ncbi:AP3-complex subunit beta-A isoform X1 [Cynara cardunculus var. scolymus]|uniref:AP3-complex subunit beta-A isoform X1 n=2 Tax=Cynara cardunculus var. scolymus TaxID=59895 RepID=UPI000D62EBC0|nr:AP3-complex subunit beta-A isoform X1 [Cynara cardunculus var. scolymus]
MFTQFGSTAENFSKASTMVFRIGTDAHLYDDPDDVSISPLLDSKFDSEKCEALKRLLALIAQGLDVSNYFPQVVKNVASQSLEVKKLVYLYLLHYAERRPNEALLSINIFQRDLGDPNPLVRAWALRTMAGIRLHVISPLVLVAVRKCARDPSVYVRKCAANALPKVHDLRLEENATAIIEIIGILLYDNSPGVVGAAAAAFASVCPNNLPLIGRNYTRLCEILPDVEEWGQIILIGILLRYVIARQGLAKESIMLSLCPEDVSHDKSGSDFDTNSLEMNKTYEMSSGIQEHELAAMVSRSYLEGPDKYLSHSTNADVMSSELDSSRFTSSKSDDDMKILLQCTSPLLWSRNSAVVLAAAGVHWIMAPRKDIAKIVKPLLFLLRSSDASKYVVLCNIQVFAKVMPSLFTPHYEDFFINSSDAYQVKALKLEILSSIATDASISVIFQEFQDYVSDPDRRFAADTVAAIGLCAKRNPQVANTCLEGLLALTSPKSVNSTSGSTDDEAVVLVQAITSIKDIIKQDPSSHDKAIIYLAQNLDAIKVPVARAMIVWIVGEYNSIGNIIPKMVSVILRYLARSFPSESIETKHQILNAAVKVLLSSKGEDFHTARSILSYVLELAKFDLNYDVRDRARILRKLLSCFYVSSSGLEEESSQKSENNELPLLLAEHVFGEKITSSEMVNNRFYLPGSLSQIVLHAAPGYEPLPEPCSLTELDIIEGMKISEEGPTQVGSYEVDNSDVDSGSLNEEGSYSYDSEDSITSSRGTDNTNEGAAREADNTDSLINFSDVGKAQKEIEVSEENDFHGELMSKGALESWLDDNPSSSQNVPEMDNERSSSARISIADISKRIRPKTHMLLDPAYGNGLRVVYKYSSKASTISSSLVSVEVSFENCSSEPISKLFLTDEDSGMSSESLDQTSPTDESSLQSEKEVPTLVPMEEITVLEPGQTTNRIIQVRFHHHLLPLKLVLWCNGKKNPVKLRPDIGYFIKPLPMDIDLFSHKESQLPGMFEYTRRCSFTDHLTELTDDKDGDGSSIKDSFLVICESLASKMLSNANVYLVSVNMPVAANLNDASGLCLRFSSEILSTSIPCLISVKLDGKCFEPLNASVKINCEETVFGLNLLNRIVNFLAEPAVTS